MYLITIASSWHLQTAALQDSTLEMLNKDFLAIFDAGSKQLVPVSVCESHTIKSTQFTELELIIAYHLKTVKHTLKSCLCVIYYNDLFIGNLLR